MALRLPEEGPTGTLPDGSRGATVSTDASGRAQIPNIHWSTTPGVAIVRVTATKGIAHAGRLIEEHLTVARLATASPVASSLPSQPVPSGPASTPSRPVAPQISRNMRPAPAIAEPKVSIETDAPAPRTNISSRPTIAPPKDDLADPHVSITGASSLPQKSHGSGKAKWVILAIAIAGGAAGGGMVLMNNKAKTPVPAPAAGLTIGAPTISIGAPH